MGEKSVAQPVGRFRVVASTPVWEVSGVNVFTANLLRGLAQRGIEGEVLLTDPDSANALPMPMDADLRVSRLAYGRWENFPTRWKRLANYLDERAPCIYLPNYDYRFSPASAFVEAGVRTVGIVHSDDPVHYEHAARMGSWWSAVVAVSGAIGTELRNRQPDLADRQAIIPYGVRIPAQKPERQAHEGPLRIVYAGRLVQPQKRVLDLPRIAAALTERGTPFVMRIVGSAYEGSVRDQLMADSEPFIRNGSMKYLGALPNEEVYAIYEDSDVVILTSEFEGLPVTLLEAMGRGCIPVVTDIPSGIPEVVKHEESGLLVPVGNIQAFAEHITRLHQDYALRSRLSEGAYRAVDRGHYRIEDMVDRYMRVFERVLSMPPARRGQPEQIWDIRPPDVRRVEMLPTVLGLPLRAAVHVMRTAKWKTINGSKRALRLLGVQVR